MVARDVTSQWRTYCFILGICGVVSTDPEFVAPVDPCRPQDVICPVTCNLMKMSGSTDCEFCFCKNPIDSVEWPDTTSTTISTSTPSTTTTLPPGHSIVNNVHYVELKNPCVLSNAMCPLKCTQRNVTLDSGKVCERCECQDVYSRQDGPQSILVGKRTMSKESMKTEIKSTGKKSQLVRKNQNPGHAPPSMMHHEFGNRPCMPFFTCPILTCPAGQHQPLAPNGCRICQCINNFYPEMPTTLTTTPRPVTTPIAASPPTTIDPANFLEMFCLPKMEDCPSMCHVTNYRVDSWNCYHCTCPDGQTFVALQKPCDVNSYVCPSNCSIRNMEDSLDPTTSCQLCDCVEPSSVIYRKLPSPLRNNKEKESSPGKAVTATPSPSIVIPMTHTPLSTAKVTTKTTPTTCYACNETNCKPADLKTCAAGKDYCMNTITQDRYGARTFSRECVGEENCYDQWRLQTANNPGCFDMYNTEKGPANQPEVCYFCCKGPSCNSAARIEDGNLYTGEDYLIG